MLMERQKPEKGYLAINYDNQLIKQSTCQKTQIQRGVIPSNIHFIASYGQSHYSPRKNQHFQPTITTYIQLPLQLPLKSMYIRKSVMQSTVTIHSGLYLCVQ